jgi:hypothetical protein
VIVTAIVIVRTIVPHPPAASRSAVDRDHGVEIAVRAMRRSTSHRPHRRQAKIRIRIARAVATSIAAAVAIRNQARHPRRRVTPNDGDRSKQGWQASQTRRMTVNAHTWQCAAHNVSHPSKSNHNNFYCSIIRSPTSSSSRVNRAPAHAACVMGALWSKSEQLQGAFSRCSFHLAAAARCHPAPRRQGRRALCPSVVHLIHARD